ncbi:MAG: Ig-like domain-containing protein [Oscillospiraceae bacterium]|nr:Ig-like domain-containing protein [Oscillospiraceae bacterium]
MKNSLSAKFLAFCLSLTLTAVSLPVLTSGAADAPCLKIQTISLTPESIPEDRMVTIDVSVSDNQTGFRSSSFGIQYDPSLIYTEYIPGSVSEKDFIVVNNPEEHLIWFMGIGNTSSEWSNISSEDVLLSLNFQIAEEVEGGTFPVQFVWQGKDGSPAYWYTDKQTDIISEVHKTAVNGSVDIHGGGAINYETLRMNQETRQQLIIYNAATSVFWFSTNPEIATVDDSGLVTAVSAGECDIQAFIDNTLQTCHVTVTEDDIYSVQGTDDLILVNPKRGVTLEYPDPVGAVTWVSANPAAISVDANGKLKIMQEGTDCSARIFATNSGKTYMKNVVITYTSESELPSETEIFTETESVVETETESETELIVPSEFPSETETVAETESETELIVTTEFPSETETVSETDPEIMLGDLDSNGSLNILDVIMINRAILGKDHLTPEQNQAADFDQNGKVESNDSLAMLKQIVGVN